MSERDAHLLVATALTSFEVAAHCAVGAYQLDIPQYKPILNKMHLGIVSKNDRKPSGSKLEAKPTVPQELKGLSIREDLNSEIDADHAFPTVLMQPPLTLRDRALRILGSPSNILLEDSVVPHKESRLDSEVEQASTCSSQDSTSPYCSVFSTEESESETDEETQRATGRQLQTRSEIINQAQEQQSTLKAYGSDKKTSETMTKGNHKGGNPTTAIDRERNKADLGSPRWNQAVANLVSAGLIATQDSTHAPESKAGRIHGRVDPNVRRFRLDEAGELHPDSRGSSSRQLYHARPPPAKRHCYTTNHS
jgi:hypothetical protein